MPPKKKIVKKVVEASTEEEYKLISLQEMTALEQKYFNRLTDLKKILSFIDEALMEVRTIKQQELNEQKWMDFLHCNPLPKPETASDIHCYYSKLKYFEKENVNKKFNWLLLVNEKSILSQDISSQNLTRSTLDATLRTNVGEEYDNYVRDSFKILQRIEKLLCSDRELFKYETNILANLVQDQLSVQKEMIDFIDRFTYRIISSENSEMSSIDAISAEYFYKASNFDLHIWCLRNVAIRFSHLSEPHLKANFHAIQFMLQIPLSMLKDNLAVRAVHMDFDHLSEKIKSFKLPIPTFADNHNSIIDLHDCLIKEWSLQMEIQAKILDEIKQNRLEYEEKMQFYVEQIEKKTKKLKKKLKAPKEPLLIDSDMIPDVYEEFVQEEQKQYENFIHAAYSPEVLGLSSHEINLRKYIILGGVYQVYFVEKPKQIDYSNTSMIWHENNSKLVINKNAKISRDPLQSSQCEIQKYRSVRRRMTLFEADYHLADPDIECPWLILTIVLPEYLCLWGEPIACFNEKVIGDEKELHAVQSAIQCTPLDSYKEGISSLVDHECKSSAKNLNFFSQDNHRKTVLQKSLKDSLLNKEGNKLSLEASQESLYVKDFSLLEVLTKSQIKNLERHIIPRLISSYKFRKEVQYEESVLFNKKTSKGKAGRTIPKASDVLPPQLAKTEFTFTDNHNPERVFVEYPTVETLHIISYLKDRNEIGCQNEPETFAELMQIIDQIKEKYRMCNDVILALKPLKQQVIPHNKNIQQLLAKKAQSTRFSSTTEKKDTKRSVLKSLKIERGYTENRQNEVCDTKSTAAFQKGFTYEASSASLHSQQNEERCEIETHLQWTKKHIIKSEFDRESRKIVLHTDRLGNLGFAFKRYEHFPFKNWTMEPNANDPENEVIFTLITQHVKCVLHITGKGIRGKVIEPLKSHLSKPKMYLVIDEPVEDFREFKKLLQAKHLNIFAEYDTSIYLGNGYYSEKHFSSELHTYNCMSAHSTQMRFHSSPWNHLAKRRDIVLKFSQYQDLSENYLEVRIIPGEAFFVEIQELRSEDLHASTLDYKLTWRNVEFYSDLHHLILSAYPNANMLRCKNPKLIYFVRDLLRAVRPLSFS